MMATMATASGPGDGNALDGLRAALRAAAEAPEGPATPGAGHEAATDDAEPLLSPRAAAANRLSLLAEAAAKIATRDDDEEGAALYRLLGDTCFYFVDPVSRPAMLDLAGRCLAALNERRARGAWPDGTVEALHARIEEARPAADDAAAIARAMGMTAEEAAAFGLTGRLTPIGLDEVDEVDDVLVASSRPRGGPGRTEGDSEEGEGDTPAPPLETLETLFVRDARELAAATLPRALHRYWKDSSSIDALLEVRRGFHTLKGDARVTAQESGAPDLEGLAILAEAAEDIVDELLGDDREGRDSRDTVVPALPAGAFGLLGESQAALLKRLDTRAPLPDEGRLLERLLAMQARSRAVRTGMPADDVVSRAGVKAPAAGTEPAARQPRADRSARLVTTFLSEADKLMPDLHRALARLSTAPDDEGALVRARTKLHTLKGGAALAGPDAAPIERLAHGCEDVLELIEDYQLGGALTTVPAVVIGSALDAEDTLQALLDDLRDARRAGGPTGSAGSAAPVRSVPPLPVPAVEELLARLAAAKEQVAHSGDTSDRAPDRAPDPVPTAPAVLPAAAAITEPAGDLPARRGSAASAEVDNVLAVLPTLAPVRAGDAPAAGPGAGAGAGREEDAETAEDAPERRLRTAMRALEDQQASRDTLDLLLVAMAAREVDVRRSNSRLRDLVERVGNELAGLRHELVRTTRRSGDWDALEKEEYSTMDVLLMQLDEALADQQDAETRLRTDLTEARAQVELQDESLLRAQRSLLDMSMIPLAHLEARLDHAVRSVARRLGKRAVFEIEGSNVTLDSRIAEALFNPLMLLISNAVDHGLEEQPADRIAAGKAEEGRVVVRGRSNGDGVSISIGDDGRGIDPDRLAAIAVSKGIVSAERAAAMTRDERIALIWQPGFSTARGVGPVSGRGMGMKGVQDDIAALQGRIEIETAVGKGTTYTITLPRSLATMRVQVVREGTSVVAIPIASVARTYAVAYDSVVEAPWGRAVRLGARTLAVYGAHLSSGPAGDAPHGLCTLLEIEGRGGGILIDEVLYSRYLPVRPAPEYLRRACGVLGYALGSGGAIIPILQPETLIDRAAPAAAAPDVRPMAHPGAAAGRHTVLVVDDSQTMRRALSQTFGKAGFVVRDVASGHEALAEINRAMPSLITLDMEMPGMDGLETLSALRRLPGGAAVPVFMVTSRQQARHRAAALAAGVTRYFTKPYDGDELIGAAHLALAPAVAATEAS